MRRSMTVLMMVLAMGFWLVATAPAAAPIKPIPDERPAAEEPAPPAAGESAPAAEEPAPAPAEEAKPGGPIDGVVRPPDVQKEAIEAQVQPLPGTDLTGMGEVAIVEELARARKAYLRALEALRQHYVERGNATKAKWAETEIEAFSKVPDLRYLTISEIAGPELKPLRTIEAADALYREGLDYKNYPAFPPAKKDYLKRALEKFETIIQKYPDSDKIDDAAFRMGEIYGGWYFEDWTRAVLAYERCWQWDPKTDYPAVFNAAKIYDEKLQNRVKAVELYNRVIAESNNQDLQNQARQRIKALTGK